MRPLAASPVDEACVLVDGATLAFARVLQGWQLAPLQGIHAVSVRGVEGVAFVFKFAMTR